MAQATKWSKMLNQEQRIPINTLYSASQLRDYVSSHKRHTVRRPIRPDN